MEAIDIFKKLNIDAMTFHEFSERRFPLPLQFVINTSGFYSVPLDCIAINELTISVPFTMMHELIHWTGHRERLHRPGIVVYDRGTTTDRRLIEAEELIANYGAMKLLDHFGLMTNREIEAFEAAMVHIKNKNFIQRMLAKRGANRAVKYILTKLDR